MNSFNSRFCGLRIDSDIFMCTSGRPKSAYVGSTPLERLCQSWNMLRFRRMQEMCVILSAVSPWGLPTNCRTACVFRKYIRLSLVIICWDLNYNNSLPTRPKQRHYILISSILQLFHFVSCMDYFCFSQQGTALYFQLWYHSYSTRFYLFLISLFLIFICVYLAIICMLWNSSIFCFHWFRAVPVMMNLLCCSVCE